MEKHAYRWTVVAIAVPLVLASGAAMAQAQTYPSKIVRLVSSAQPGSMPDTIGRFVADKLTVTLGGPVIVEPHPGAAGLTGGQYVARGNPDGYLIGVYTASDTLAPLLNPGVLDPKELTPVASVATVPTVLVVGAASRYKSFGDLVAAAKAEPGKIVVASAGFVTATHLTFERFRTASGLIFLHVPFKGNVGAITALLAGRADMYFAPVPAALPLVKSGKVRTLAMGSPRRSALLPEVQTTLELGYPNSDYNFWIGISAPAKTPRPIVLRLNKAIDAAVAAPDMQERLLKAGAEPWTIGLAELEAMVKNELESNARLIKTPGFKVE